MGDETRLQKDLALIDVAVAARMFLNRIDMITTDEFASGGDRQEREALRLALIKAERINLVAA